MDVHLSKDGRIVVMHDTTIDRTTTGTGNIGNMTLAEIQNYTLKDGQHIPVLEEVFDVLEDHKDVVLVLELKAGDTIAEKIDALIGKGDGQYDVRDQLVIITFNNSGDDLLTDIKEVMPTVPTAYLLSGNKKDTLMYDLASMGHYNCGFDMGYNDDVHQASYNKECLTDRGISNWYWTFNTKYAIVEQAELGHVGVTNNMASVLQPMIYSIQGVPGQEKSTLQVGDTVSVTATKYDGMQQVVDGTVFYLQKADNGWNTIAMYTFTTANGHSMTLYSSAFIVEEETLAPNPNPGGDKTDDNKGDEEKPKNGGCSGSLDMSVGAVGALLLGACVYLLLRRRKVETDK